MAAGRIITGFSKPYVAAYSESSGTVTYSSGQVLARGVNVNVSIDDSETNPFYADNISAEDDPNVVISGTIELTVDGLKDAAEALLFSLEDADTNDWIHYGADASAAYVGVGFVVRYMEAGVQSYVPVIIRKTKFQQSAIDAATQEESIDWQTQTLSGRFYADDTSLHDWKWKGEAQTTEATAEGMIKSVFNITG